MVAYAIPPKRVFFFWIYAGIGLTAYYLPLNFWEGPRTPTARLCFSVSMPFYCTGYISTN